MGPESCPQDSQERASLLGVCRPRGSREKHPGFRRTEATSGQGKASGMGPLGRSSRRRGTRDKGSGHWEGVLSPDDGSLAHLRPQGTHLCEPGRETRCTDPRAPLFLECDSSPAHWLLKLYSKELTHRPSLPVLRGTLITKGGESQVRADMQCGCARPPGEPQGQHRAAPGDRPDLTLWLERGAPRDPAGVSSSSL